MKYLIFLKKIKNVNIIHYWRLEPYLAFGPGAHGFDGKKDGGIKNQLIAYIDKLNKNI